MVTNFGVKVIIIKTITGLYIARDGLMVRYINRWNLSIDKLDKEDSCTVLRTIL